MSNGIKMQRSSGEIFNASAGASAKFPVKAKQLALTQLSYQPLAIFPHLTAPAAFYQPKTLNQKRGFQIPRLLNAKNRPSTFKSTIRSRGGGSSCILSIISWINFSQILSSPSCSASGNLTPVTRSCR
jgi:hypothetical protein